LVIEHNIKINIGISQTNIK